MGYITDEFYPINYWSIEYWTGDFPLVNSPANDLAILLERAGLGITETDIFVGTMPDLPNFCIVTYDTGGFPPNAKYLREEPTVQIRVRGNAKNLNEVEIKMREIRDALLNSGNQIVDGSTYTQYHEFLGVLTWPKDEKDRPVQSTNFRLVRLIVPSIETNREVL